MIDRFHSVASERCVHSGRFDSSLGDKHIAELFEDITFATCAVFFRSLKQPLFIVVVALCVGS